MKKRSWRFRFFVWYAKYILLAPYTVDFTPPESENLIGIGFAFSTETAQRMQANYTTLPPRPTRAARRAMKRAFKRAAEKGAH